MTSRRMGPLWQPHALAAFLACCGLAHAQEAPPVFDRDSVAAAGSQTVELHVASPGRYSVRATSKSGVGLRVVDRMSGWSALAGAPGESDGRLDLFLDRGVVRVVTAGAKLASGEARLSAMPFIERHPEGLLPVLPENRLVSESLADLESASWWIEVGERRRLTVEAAGRSLADLRLWRDGAWLLADSPSSEVIAPAPQRPLVLLRLSADLEPGLYRLSAYGGPAQPWSKESDEQPLYLRTGIPRLPATGRAWHVVSPFGFDRYVAPGKSDILRLELPEPKAASLDVWDWDEAAPFPALDDAERQPIAKDSLPPVSGYEHPPQDGDRLIEVRGDAGQPYVLQQATHMESPLELGGRAGSYWLALLNTGGVVDSLDPTALLVRRQGDGRSELLATRAVPLSRSRGWARRFNLEADATLYLEVQEPGEYELVVGGLSAQARVEPVRLDPSDAKTPRMRALPASWTLPAGLYLLTLSSVDQGAISLAVKPHGLRDPLVDWVGSGEPPEGARPHAAAQFGVVRLAPRQAAEVLASQTGTRLGLVLRATPIDVEDALPIAVEPGAELEVPVRASRPGRLTATADDGTRLELALDGGPWSESVEVAAGEHQAKVRATGAGPRVASLELVPRERLADTPLLAATGPAGPPAPELRAPHEGFFDLERAATRTFLLAAPESGLYRVESTGLLRTLGSLRTRVAPSLATAQENGSGRNFLLSNYLREGDYQLSVSALGDSAGHAGISLRRAALRDGGELVEGLAARSWVAPDEALAYRFSIDRAGRFEVRADGLQGAFDLRFEDREGWPVDVPSSGLSDLELQPGDYRLLVLPRAVPARAVVRFDRLPEPQARSGHGPHALPLGETVNHVWTEPPAEGPRDPDRWRFVLPAAATVEVTLDAEMTGEIRAGGGGEPVAKVQPGRPLRTELAAGEYEIDVRCSRRNNQAPYSLRVAPVELVAGTTQTLTPPVELPVAIGSEGFYEIESTGAEDVRARLIDAAGRSVDANDDRPGDWNFLLARRLAAGRYTLRVDGAAGAGAFTQVALRERAETTAPPLRAPGANHLTAGAEQWLVPLELPARADFLAATAQTSDGLGLTLERDGGDGWRVVSQDQGRAVRVAVALAEPGSRYRLRVRALDRRPLDVALAAWAGVVPRASERALRDGVALRALPGLAPSLAVSSVELREPGCLEVLSAPDDLEQAIGAGQPLRPAGGVLAASGRTLWLAAPSTGGEVKVAARRALLGNAATRTAITLAAATALRCDVQASPGPRWVKVSTLGGGEPLVAFGDRPLPSATATEAQEALAIDLGGGATNVRAWVAGSESPEARLETRAFAALTRESLSWGAREIDLGANTAHRYALPPGIKTVRLSLGEGSAALWLAGDEPQGALWASREPLEEHGETTADGLLVLTSATGRSRARLEVLPAESAAGTRRRAPDGRPLLSTGERHETRFAQDGVERLAVAAGSSGRLRVRGARRATLLGDDGTLARGSDLEIPAAGGTLLVEHGAGIVAAWIEPVGDAGPSTWGFTTRGAQPLATPATLALSGEQVEYRIEAPEPRLLHVRPSSGLAAGLTGPAAPRFDVLAQPRPFVAYLPPGETTLLLRGLAGEALTGNAEITAEPLTPLGEGLGDAVLLAAGGARGYRFHVDGARRVGVGVQADASGVEAAIFDARGEPLGQGVAQWLDLEPGDYAVVLLAPSSGGPVAARPALVGLLPPGSGPPPEVVSELLTRLRGVETTTGGTPFQPAPPAALLGVEESADDDSQGESRDEEYDGEESETSEGDEE